jgi:uncharacterized DUF497 family protein
MVVSSIAPSPAAIGFVGDGLAQPRIGDVIHRDAGHAMPVPCGRVLGRIGSRLFLVVYTPRGDVLRIISARKANAKEVSRYGDGSRKA